MTPVFNQTEFRVLMHSGIYVDANLLEKGIYAAIVPHLYRKEETIATMILKAKQVQEYSGITFITEKYFENLKQCKLVWFALIESALQD